MFLPDVAKNIISQIEKSGYHAYAAGATVREIVMNEMPVAFVMATDAPKEVIRSLFKRTIDNKNRNNSIVVMENKTAFEFFCPLNNKKPSKELIKDILYQFDFTINSMAYNETDGIIDYFGGMSDLENKTVRFVNNSHLAIAEKPVRMLRAVRYCAQLGFSIDEKTVADIKKCSMLIKRGSNDKIREELDKVLLSENPGAFKMMHELGILRYIMPELDTCFYVPQRNKYHIYNVGEHITHAVMNTPEDAVLRWAALLHDIGKPECKSVDSNGIIHFYGHHRGSVRLATDILRRYKIDAQVSKDILTLIENHDVRIEATPLGVKKMMARTGSEVFSKLLILQEADNKAKNMKFFPDKKNKINDVRRIYQKVIAERHPYKLSDLVVNGRDLNKLGFRPGHEVSDTLQSLLEEVLINPELNNRDYLIQRAKYYRKKKH